MDKRSFDALPDSGVLWAINRLVFHPRGFALTLHVQDGVAIGWSIQGNGKEVWTFDIHDDDDQFNKFEALLDSLK
jgi:hypothetical protein